MIHAVGATTNTNSAPVTDNEQRQDLRPVVRVQADHIQQLTKVLVGTSATSPTVWFQFNNSADLPLTHRVGPLAASLVEAVSFSPVHGPCLAALVLCLHQSHLALETSSESGNWLFSHRVVSYALASFARDLDSLVLVDGCQGETDLPCLMVRVRLMLQFFVHLAKLGIVQTYHSDEDTTDIAAAPVTLAGLLRAMVYAAEQAAQRHNIDSIAAILAMPVLNVIPLLNTTDLTTEWIQESLIDPLVAILQGYKSDFAPGVGRTAILLQADQRDDVGEMVDSSIGDEEEDDEEDEDEPTQVCDSLQDLLRSVQHWGQVQSKVGGPISRFGPFSDAPWHALIKPTQLEQQQAQEEPMTYTGKAVRLDIFPICRSLHLLLLGGDMAGGIRLAKPNLNGLVFGRLPIFGPPPDLEDVDDEDEEEDDIEVGLPLPTNESLEAYKKEFVLVDRFFLGQAIRDIVLMHASCVSAVGIERGSAKTVAEQVWALASMVIGEAKGMEYLVLETLLSLIVQSSAASPFRQMHVCRVILELTRLAPSIVSPTIALAVSNLFQDYMPALVPTARYNLGVWIAFHLTNTDYQWPSGYWKQWEPFVLFGWRNSRGAFVKAALEFMAENLSEPQLLITNCLPRGSALADHVFDSRLHAEIGDSHPCMSLVSDVTARIWDGGDDASVMLSFLTGEELSEGLAGASWGEYSRDRSWFRTFILWRAIAAPMIAEFSFIQRAIAAAKAGNDDAAMDEDPPDDALAKVLDILHQYRVTFIGVLAKDADGNGSEVDAGGLYMLKKVCDVSNYSRALQTGIIQALLIEEIVSPLIVLKYLLGDGVEGTPNDAVLRWWELASMAIQVVLTKHCPNAAAGSESTDISQEGSIHTTLASDLLIQVEPVLSYVVRRVCTLIPVKDNGTSRLSSEQVDLVEGLKSLILATKMSFLAVLGADSGGYSAKRTEIEDVFLQSAIVRQAMDALGIDCGSATAGLLHCWKILENL